MKHLGKAEKFRSEFWGTVTVSQTGKGHRVEQESREEEKQEDVMFRDPVRSCQRDQ